MHGRRVAAQLSGGILLLEQSEQVLNQPVIQILATQVGVTRCRQDLEDARVDTEERNVERASSQVKHEHRGRVQCAVETIGERRGRGLVEDAQHVEPRNSRGVLGGLSLRIVEIRRNRHNRIPHLSAQKSLSGLSHPPQHHCGHLLRQQLLRLPAGRHLDRRLALSCLYHFERPVRQVGLNLLIPEHATDETLGIIDGVGRVQRRLRPRRVSHQPLASICERHPGRCDAVALIIRDDLDLAILVDANAGVGRAQIDADHRAERLIREQRREECQ
mmetsp:Transcript_9663/g.32100  ORF Transcript_9663/g.32100 Transcript_9663/m.32100 type:complete len:274 (-) Transcript_9663:31-852(-)